MLDTNIKKIYLNRASTGAMAERSKAAVLKTVIQQCIGGSNPSRSVSFDDAWRRGRAVIQRIANPSVPYGLGRFNSCRLRETNASFKVLLNCLRL